MCYYNRMLIHCEMKPIFTTFICGMITMTSAAVNDIVSTSAYRWSGDTIYQGEYIATAVSPFEIQSTYSAQPGFFMPVSKEWKKKNDLSSYPALSSTNRLHEAVYNMALDEMVNAVEPDTTLRTGKEWAGVWTRDVSYSILLSMAYLQPEASRISLMKKVDPLGRIIQDTGSGGAWPVSTDREIWCIAAYEVYKVTGDRKWLEYIYPIIKRSLETDAKTVYDFETGLVKGETSFIDWREQSHPKWMQCADIYNTETLSTSIVHAQAWKVFSEIADELGHKKEARIATEMSEKIAAGINKNLWMDDKGYYAMYLYGRDNLITNPRAETLGESLAIMWDVADADRAKTITENNPTTPFGTAIFFPQIADMTPYHNNALWPWVGAWWAIANAKAGNEDGVMQGIGAIMRPAALFCTNKENFNLDNGDIYTELNSSNMLWCLSGNLALTHKILFGIEYAKDALLFHPFVPTALAGELRLDNYKYRDAMLDITVKGYGNEIKSFTVNGKEQNPEILAKNAKGNMKVEIVMADNEIPAMRVNNIPNLKAPLTPIAWLEDKVLCWNPIEYINHYVVIRDGQRIAETTTTTFDASVAGEYQVMGVADNGTEGFASEPRSTRKTIVTQIPDESTVIESQEVAYHPEKAVDGYNGNGFIELDKSTPTVNIPVTVDKEGKYGIQLRYANGNGPVNTENRCGVRTISVDGKDCGIVVMPHRGRNNWSDWGLSNTIFVNLSPGQHTVSVSFLPENENMNIATNHVLVDELRLTKVK